MLPPFMRCIVLCIRTLRWFDYSDCMMYISVCCLYCLSLSVTLPFWWINVFIQQKAAAGVTRVSQSLNDRHSHHRRRWSPRHHREWERVTSSLEWHSADSACAHSTHHTIGQSSANLRHREIPRHLPDSTPTGRKGTGYAYSLSSAQALLIHAQCTTLRSQKVCCTIVYVLLTIRWCVWCNVSVTTRCRNVTDN